MQLWWAEWIRCVLPPCWLSLVAALLAGAVPPFRCRARRHLHRRGGGIRTSRARTDDLDGDRCCCSASENRRCLSYVVAYPDGWVRAVQSKPRWRPPSSSGDIDYINLHGTGTPATTVESRAVTSVFGRPRLAVRPRAHRSYSGCVRCAGGVISPLLSAWMIAGGVHTNQIDRL